MVAESRLKHMAVGVLAVVSVAVVVLAAEAFLVEASSCVTGGSH